MKDKLDGLPKTLNGSSKTYYKNGKLRVERNYLDGKLHGRFKNYNEDGSLRGEGSFIKGELEGIFKFKIKDIGTEEFLIYEINFRKGKIDGLCKEFYGDGKLKSEFYFDSGEITNIQDWKRYLKDGEVSIFSKQEMTNLLFYTIGGQSQVLNEVDLRRKLKYR